MAYYTVEINIFRQACRLNQTLRRPDILYYVFGTSPGMEMNLYMRLLYVVQVIVRRLHLREDLSLRANMIITGRHLSCLCQ